MTFTVLKEKLHDYIDHADQKKLTAIYTLVEDEIIEPRHTYDEETLNMLEERREEYQKGNIKGYTVEESMEHVKQELTQK